MRDLHNNIAPRSAIPPAAAITTNTPVVSTILDTLGFDSAELVILLGDLADADATFAVLIEHGNAANMSDAAAVPATDLLGTTAQAGFTFAADNAVRKIGYVGPRRYLRATVTPANNSGNAFIAAVWILGHPSTAPTPNPPT